MLNEVKLGMAVAGERADELSGQVGQFPPNVTRSVGEMGDVDEEPCRDDEETGRNDE